MSSSIQFTTHPVVTARSPIRLQTEKDPQEIQALNFPVGTSSASDEDLERVSVYSGSRRSSEASIDTIEPAIPPQEAAPASSNSETKQRVSFSKEMQKIYKQAKEELTSKISAAFDCIRNAFLRVTQRFKVKAKEEKIKEKANEIQVKAALAVEKAAEILEKKKTAIVQKITQDINKKVFVLEIFKHLSEDVLDKVDSFVGENGNPGFINALNGFIESGVACIGKNLKKYDGLSEEDKLSAIAKERIASIEKAILKAEKSLLSKV